MEKISCEIKKLLVLWPDSSFLYIKKKRVTGERRHCHITPVLNRLPKLPVTSRIRYEILTFIDNL